MAASGYFGDTKLAALAKQVPADLQILRLRLRFGLPPSLVLGQCFRIALELVDEMGQAVALRPPQREELSIRIVSELSDDSARSRDADVELTVHEVRASGNQTQQQRKSCTWTFDAVFTRRQQTMENMTGALFQMTAARDCSADAPLKTTLSIQLRRHSTDTSNNSSDTTALVAPEQQQVQEDKASAGTPLSAFHSSFQRFCADSTWLDASTLVLALHSQPIELTRSRADGIESPTPPTSSLLAATNLCRRVFAVEALGSASSSPLSATTPEATPPSIKYRQLVEITENYGDTMGAHIWDASILLSYALCHASHDNVPFSGMLELGAGCGLFAAVYAAFHGVSTLDSALRPPHHVVLTERAESIRLLEANLAHNRIGVDPDALTVTVAPLVWGESPPVALTALLGSVGIGAIFAADVLYSWSAHEALLASLEAFVTQQAQRRKETSGHSTPPVVTIAHKHRSRATSDELERVLEHSASRICASAKTDACAWTHWRVTRAARLGAVELLELRLVSTSD